MTKRFVFFVNADYCYSIFRPLQEEVLRQGYEAAWFFVRGLDAKLAPGEICLGTEEQVKSYAPDAIFAAGDWVPHYLPGYKVMVFHGLSINKRGTKQNAHYKIRGWYDLYCTHAEQDTQIFIELSKQNQNFRVAHTGWPKLDSLFKLKKNYTGHAKKEKTVFFASTFSPSITAAPYVLDKLIEISKSEGWSVIATLHPLMDEVIVQQYKSARSSTFKYLSASENLYEAMIRSDVMLCDTSSVMYEFMFLDKPVVTFRTKNPGDFISNVNEVDDIFPALEKAVNDSDIQRSRAQEVCKDLHSFSDGESSKRVLEATIAAIQTGNIGLKPRKISAIRRLKLRKRLGYWGC